MPSGGTGTTFVAGNEKVLHSGTDRNPRTRGPFKIEYHVPMFEKVNNKDVMLIYAVIGFGSIALIALGELSGVDVDSFLFRFYLKLVFGGFLVFYSVLVHLVLLPFSKNLDEKGPRFLKVVLGERSSRSTTVIIALLVLIYWIWAFAELINASGFNFF